MTDMTISNEEQDALWTALGEPTQVTALQRRILGRLLERLEREQAKP